MSDLPAWRLWLDDERAARVRQTLESIGAALLALPSEKIPPPPGLTAGMPGVALAHAYLAQAGLGEAHEERCHALIEESIEHIGDLAGDCSLAGGVSGLAFVLEHLGANQDDDNCAELDDIIHAELDKRDDLPIELMWGLTGRAVYARERLPRASGRTLLDALVARLLTLARPQPDGALAWFNPPDARFVGAPIMDEFPDGTFNLGVAHGNPGVIALLAACADPAAQAAARAGMRWMWSQRFASGPAAFAIVAGGPPYPTHGWCYGDEGIGVVLHAAARSLGDAEWQARWLEILRGCAGRAPTTERGLTLCHGTAGTAHLWHRAYQAMLAATPAATPTATAEATAEPALRDATLAWLDATLDALPGEAAPWPGLLDGTAGLALALAAFVSEVEPAWDRLFALSLRAPA